MLILAELYMRSCELTLFDTRLDYTYCLLRCKVTYGMGGYQWSPILHRHYLKLVSGIHKGSADFALLFPFLYNILYLDSMN